MKKCMLNAMRILITVDSRRPPVIPNIPHAYATQIEFLHQAGQEVFIFGIDDRTSLRGIIRNWQELSQEIHRFSPDVLVTYYGTMVAAISALAAGNCPLVITFRGSDLLGSSNPGWKWRIRDTIARLLSLYAALAASQIHINGAGLLKALPTIFHSKAHNIPNGTDASIFQPQDRDSSRRKLGWDLSAPVILFNAGTGSGKVVKNLPLAEQVAAIVVQFLPETHLEAMSGLNRSEVCLRMNAADCLLITSLHEGSPDLVKEAMACNLPIVSVPCGDISERLKGVSLSSIHPYDPTPLAAAVGDVLRSGQRSNGRAQLFDQGLDAHAITQRVLEVYRLAADRKSV